MLIRIITELVVPDRECDIEGSFDPIIIKAQEQLAFDLCGAVKSVEVSED
jgi:hypothetical protein